MDQKEFIYKLKSAFERYTYTESRNGVVHYIDFNQAVRDPEGTSINVTLVRCIVLREDVTIEWYEKIKKNLWKITKRTGRFDEVARDLPGIVLQLDDVREAIKNYNYVEDIQILNEAGFVPVRHYPTRFRIEDSPLPISIQLMDFENRCFFLCEMVLGGEDDRCSYHYYKNVKEALSDLMRMASD